MSDYLSGPFGSTPEYLNEPTLGTLALENKSDSKPCGHMTGAHLQVACAEARKVGRGHTSDDLLEWMKEVGYDWRTNTFSEYRDPAAQGSGYGKKRGVGTQKVVRISDPAHPDHEKWKREQAKDRARRLEAERERRAEHEKKKAYYAAQAAAAAAAAATKDLPKAPATQVVQVPGYQFQPSTPADHADPLDPAVMLMDAPAPTLMERAKQIPMWGWAAGAATVGGLAWWVLRRR